MVSFFPWKCLYTDFALMLCALYLAFASVTPEDVGGFWAPYMVYILTLEQIAQGGCGGWSRTVWSQSCAMCSRMMSWLKRKRVGFPALFDSNPLVSWGESRFSRRKLGVEAEGSPALSTLAILWFWRYNTFGQLEENSVSKSWVLFTDKCSYSSCCIRGFFLLFHPVLLGYSLVF